MNACGAGRKPVLFSGRVTTLKRYWKLRGKPPPGTRLRRIDTRAIISGMVKKEGHGMRGGHVPFGDRYGYPTSGETVAHYYGDFVREFLLGGAVVMLLTAPFYADELRAELPIEVITAVILVALAAMTSPWKKSILVADAIAAGVVTIVYQIWALNGYGTTTNVIFVLREAISIIFLFAFYFSVKTVRAMVLHQIGKRVSPDEFAEKQTSPSEDSEDNPVSRIKHAFDDGPVDDDETPPHRPTFYKK